MASDNQDVYHTIIIGAGVMGSATAHYLAQDHGEKILLLEQFDFLHRRGSSHGDSRITRLTYPEDHYTYLMLQSRNLWKEAEEESGFQVYTKTGGLDIGNHDNARLQSIIAAAKRHNVPHQVLTCSQIQARFPHFKLPEEYIGVYCESSGVLNATKATSMFQQLARQNGCRLIDRSPVTEIMYTTNGTDRLFQVKTSTGIFKATNCILTAGAWTQPLLNKLKTPQNIQIRLPLEAKQTTVVYWSVLGNSAAFCGKDMRMPVFIDYQINVYGLPAVEFPTLIKFQTHYGDPVDPDNRDFQPPERDIENVLLPYVKAHLNEVTPKPVRTESCMYTMTPDQEFIVDKVQNVPGLILGCGFSGHGFKLAPMVAKMLAAFVKTGENPFPQVSKYLSMGRFQ